MVSIYIKVKPGSSRDEISIDKEGSWVVRIREKPIQGAANDYLIKFLSKEMKIPKSSILIEKGHISPVKKISIQMTPEELQNWITRYSGSV